MTNTETNSLYKPRQVLTIAFIAAGYLFLSRLLIGFRIEQVYLVLLFSGFYFLSWPSRKFITGFSIFIIFWIVFDYMKAFPNYHYHTVHIESLYQAEKKYFGIQVQGNILTPNEYLQQHSNTFLDILTGLFYLCWVPVPLAFAAYLFFKNRMAFLHFSLSFLLVNLMGFIIYYLYPAAPPWYVQQHGFSFIPATRGNTGGLEKFDIFFGRGIFRSLYSKSSNVFAAMPSLHSAYPLLVFFYGLKYKLGRINILFAVIMLGIWFAAVYTSHHYIWDVLAGIFCAFLSIAGFQWLVWNNSKLKKFVQKFAERIT